MIAFSYQRSVMWLHSLRHSHGKTLPGLKSLASFAVLLGSVPFRVIMIGVDGRLGLYDIAWGNPGHASKACGIGERADPPAPQVTATARIAYQGERIPLSRILPAAPFTSRATRIASFTCRGAVLP